MDSIIKPFWKRLQMCPAVKPTAPEIVNIQRPERPAFFDDCRLNLHYEIPVEKDRKMLLDFIYEHYLQSVAYQQAFKKHDDREY